jgi:ComF family protein
MRKCPVCNKASIDGVTHPRCRGKLHIAGATAFVAYTGVIRQYIRQMKYRHMFDATDEIIDSIWERPDVITQVNILPTCFRTQSIVVPIPLHPSRLKDRGYNQAEKIAQSIAQKLKRPVMSELFVRAKNTPSQVLGAKRDIRLQNIKNAFLVPDSMKIRVTGSYILLIDDVVTTGATVRSAGAVLLKSGAAGVWVMSIA